MTQIFAEDGTVTPVTVIKAGPCVVVQTKSAAGRDGYNAVQLGLVEDNPIRLKNVSKPLRGHFEKTGGGVPPTRILKEIRLTGEPEAVAHPGPAYAQGATSSQYPVRRPPATPMPGDTSTSQNSPAPQRQAVDAPRQARRGSAVRTRPVPQYQPLPAMRGRGSAKFTLLVGPDGRVRDVNIERTMVGGNTPALVGAIQNWRFKPATENGEPVAAPFSVEISFGRE